MSPSDPRPVRLPGCAIAATALVALLFVSNVRFYWGFTVEHVRVRVEHGRVTVHRSVSSHRPKPFWLDLNSEDLRFAPVLRLHSADEWRVVLPLWMPLCAGGLWILWGLRRRRPRTVGGDVAP